jgi:cardiolipin synthase
MFSIKALDKFEARGRSLPSYLLYVRECFGETSAHLKQRPSLALEIARFTVASHVVVLLLLAFFFLPTAVSGYIRIMIPMACVAPLLVGVILLNIGLVRTDDQRPERSLGLANRLTILRLVLVAPLVVLIVDDRMGLALAVYTVCAGTDVVDGIVARRRGQRTDFGTMMDPAADIISTAAVFAAFWAKGLVPGWVFIVLMIRYGMLITGSMLIFFTVGPFEFKATRVGKIVGVLQAAAVIMIIVFTLSGAEWQSTAGAILFPFLGTIFGAVIISQLVLGMRHVRKGATNAGSRRQSAGI